MNQEYYNLGDVLNIIMKEITKRDMDNQTHTVSGEELRNMLGHYNCPMCSQSFLTEQEAKDHKAFTNVAEYKERFIDEQIGSIEPN